LQYTAKNRRRFAVHCKKSPKICSTLQKIKEDLQYTANVLLAVTASDDNEIFGKDEPSTGRKDH
jgi:hypothetical protein